MIFNSIAFAIFLPIVFVLYWFVLNRSLKLQNFLLLVASYFFYVWWDWRFLLLLMFISLTNYFICLKIGDNEADKSRVIWLRLGLLLNIGVLCVFKYYNFFIDSFIDLVSLTGYDLPRSTLRIILPLGISFYTFLTISYIVDVYKNNTKAHRNLAEVLLAFSFFPIIIAGPIQRPSDLLPQIASRREFDYEQAVDGLKQILWGLFAKIVIADNLAVKVDDIFQSYSNYQGSTLLIGAILYSIQIYADFSGYSNMAIGIGKLFGFKLMQNFAYPYFARDISEFWKKWHISLTTWFRDYVFLPISIAISWNVAKDKVLFMRTDFFIYIVASVITWFLTGLWHGANYTFIIWGMIHGLFLILHHWQKKPRKLLLSRIGLNNSHILIVIFERLITLAVVVFAWIFFRSDSIQGAQDFISRIFTSSLFTDPDLTRKTLFIIFLVMVYMFIEWLGKEQQHAIHKFAEKKHPAFRWAFYYFLILLVVFLAGNEQDFIYLQF